MTMIIKTRRKAPNMSINKQSNTRSAWRPISSCHSHHYSVSGTCMRLHFEECDGAVGVTSMIVYSDIYIYIYICMLTVLSCMCYIQSSMIVRPSVYLSVHVCVCVCPSCVIYSGVPEASPRSSQSRWSVEEIRWPTCAVWQRGRWAVNGPRSRTTEMNDHRNVT